MEQRKVKGPGSPGPAEPGTGSFRSVPWTMRAESWGPLPAAPKTPQACSETPTGGVRGFLCGPSVVGGLGAGVGGGVFLTGHQG